MSPSSSKSLLTYIKKKKLYSYICIIPSVCNNVFIVFTVLQFSGVNSKLSCMLIASVKTHTVVFLFCNVMLFGSSYIVLPPLYMLRLSL